MSKQIFERKKNMHQIVESLKHKNGIFKLISIVPTHLSLMINKQKVYNVFNIIKKKKKKSIY